MVWVNISVLNFSLIGWFKKSELTTPYCFSTYNFFQCYSIFFHLKSLPNFRRLCKTNTNILTTPMTPTGQPLHIFQLFVKWFIWILSFILNLEWRCYFSWQKLLSVVVLWIVLCYQNSSYELVVLWIVTLLWIVCAMNFPLWIVWHPSPMHNGIVSI